MRVAIIDYGSGNLRSAVKAFERAAADNGIDARIVLTNDPERVRVADRIVLPGVGAFADCRAGLLARLAEEPAATTLRRLGAEVAAGAAELARLCDDLISRRGEASGVALARGGAGQFSSVAPYVIKGVPTKVVSGSLGAQFIVWEYATAIAGQILGINPFDQPDVESAKQAARDLLDGGSSDVDVPQSVDGDVEIRTTGEEGLSIAATVEEALAALLTRLDTDHGYLAVMAYLDREGDSALSGVDEALAARTGRPVTFGWGPRFLHSTGQYHKGGPATGVYLQITDTPREDMPVPGRDFTLGQFIAAQAGGDAAVLHEKGRPVLRLHARTPEGVARIADALRAQG